MEAIVVVIILLMPLRVLNIGKNYPRELDNLTVGKTAEHRMLYFYTQRLDYVAIIFSSCNGAARGWIWLLKKQILGRVHGVLGRQLFENAETFLDMREKPTAPKISQNGTSHESSLETVNVLKNYAGK
ncbi:hypothetical protein Pint_14441 [Pistacia integerrima]|uniref:Uncharacterized protein n=1 Tax=Pistacia integerrima TaxID=434235 RepID=A0ACC0Y8J5_9ROSI|nr:hypothetical protein Pint_14441 [Pistacia integerrima]